MPDNPTAAVKSRLNRAADDAADVLRNEARGAVETAKGGVERHVETAKDAASAAADQFDPGSVEAHAANQVADTLDQVTQAISQLDLDTVARDARAFARSNPLLCIGGAALLGFSAARFLKASERPPSAPVRSDADPWTGHVTSIPVPDAEAPQSSERLS